MIDRPILFSAPMVQAILAERKTQTRRILKLPTKGEYVRQDMGGWEASVIGGTSVTDGKGNPVPQQPCVWNQTTGTCVSPNFAIGDRLWVKEQWYTDRAYDDLAPSQMGGEEGLFFPADRTALRWDQKGWLGRQRSSIHMPRWASRLTLAVTDVRVERLQDISEADALAEGIERLTYLEIDECGWPERKFHDMWDRINGKRIGAGWVDNPWVVAVSFDVAHRNIDAS